MKKTTLLHAELSHCIATLGHGDMLVIGDAGLPIPAGVKRIDLALTLGTPSLSAVLQAVLSEMHVEQAIIANESIQHQKFPAWYEQAKGQGLPAMPQLVAHEDFKTRTRSATAVVRSREATPYANIILVAGVMF